MISIIIPAFNEEDRIASSLEKLSTFLKKRPEEFEVIVVDDASTDGTGKLAKSFASKIPNLKVIRLEKSPFEGKGLAVNKGALATKGEVVVFTDADFSTPIEEIGKLLRKLEEGFDIAIGSRALDRSLVKTKQSAVREFMGRVFNFLVQRITLPGIVDTQCGFKAFKMRVCRQLFEKEKIFDFGFDVELLYLARKKGLKIVEIPVIWNNHPTSKVHPIKDSVSMFADLFKIRLYHANKNGSLADKFFYQFYARRTLWRFVTVGTSGTLVDYSLFFVLTRYFNLPALVANPISVETAIIWNFTWNNLWTFSEREIPRPFWKKFLIFQFVSLGGLLLSQNSLFIFNRIFNIFDLVAKALTLPIVASFNYLVNSRWTFRDLSAGRSMWRLYMAIIFLLFVIYVSLII
ncbi:MAG: hypothetical protein A2Z42_04050 [Candidatus Woykebacteria bacterium RBG_19FT_COMBO_43_10]|uniref:dolichyl-phosphate beta-glucosyltransferase n=1 Tax=Candidatus Woykebacteria bacterium RBG_19FT_COMBO_43_10 TaxID=1802598 RepID=A0A1G1WH42_9BACT|nr:MAG: hypothetical protein A2Z42_04050 [Candidatus Woykebacteria bacterium RBG_19FT_COMBO_43_10]